MRPIATKQVLGFDHISIALRHAFAVGVIDGISTGNGHQFHTERVRMFVVPLDYALVDIKRHWHRFLSDLDVRRLLY